MKKKQADIIIKLLYQIRNLLICLCEDKGVEVPVTSACAPEDPNCDPTGGPPPGGP